MTRCWELRDCDEEMESRCPHSAEPGDRCPADCAYARCTRPSHAVTTDPGLVFSAAVDREKAVKEECFHCEFFLTKGPETGSGDGGRVPSEGVSRG